MQSEYSGGKGFHSQKGAYRGLHERMVGESD